MSKFGTGFGTYAELDISNLDQIVDGKDAITRRHDGGGTVIYVSDFTPRVRHGIVVLDVVAPGWVNEIDLGVLDLEHPDKCVLGQTWPHYGRLLELAGRSLAFTGPDFAIRPPIMVAPDAVNSRYHHMLAHLTATMDEGRDNFAASIGCTLANEDYNLANLQAKKIVVDRVGELLARSNAAAEEMSTLARQMIMQMFEQLTSTWLHEISALQATSPAYPDVVDLRTSVGALADRELLST